MARNVKIFNVSKDNLQQDEEREQEKGKQENGENAPTDAEKLTFKQKELFSDVNVCLEEWFNLIVLVIDEFSIPYFPAEKDFLFPETKATLKITNLSDKSIPAHTGIDIFGIEDTDNISYLKSHSQTIGQTLMPHATITIRVPLLFKGLSFKNFPRGFTLLIDNPKVKIVNPEFPLETCT